MTATVTKPKVKTPKKVASAPENAKIQESDSNSTVTVSSPAAEETFTKVQGSRLVGAELSALAKEYADRPEEEICRAAGYYTDTVNEEGEIVSTRFAKQDLYIAVAAANGLVFEKAARAPRAGGTRAVRPYTKVGSGNGKIQITSHYGEKAGFEKGQKVWVSAEEGKITITAEEPNSSF